MHRLQHSKCTCVLLHVCAAAEAFPAPPAATDSPNHPSPSAQRRGNSASSSYAAQHLGRLHPAFRDHARAAQVTKKRPVEVEPTRDATSAVGDRGDGRIDHLRRPMHSVYSAGASLRCQAHRRRRLDCEEGLGWPCSPFGCHVDAWLTILSSCAFHCGRCCRLALAATHLPTARYAAPISQGEKYAPSDTFAACSAEELLGGVKFLSLRHSQRGVETSRSNRVVALSWLDASSSSRTLSPSRLRSRQLSERSPEPARRPLGYLQLHASNST